MQSVRLFAAELRRQWQQSWSYRFDLLGDLLLWLISFPLLLVLFAGVADGYGRQEQMAALIGFLVWNLTMSVISATTRDLVQEMRTGTLEPLLLSPVSPLLLFPLRVVAAFATQALRTLLLGALLMLVLRLPIVFNGAALAVLLLTVTGALGVGLLLGGIALVHKQIASLIGVISLLALLVTGALVPLNSLGTTFVVLKWVVPITWGIDALRAVLLENASWIMLWHDFTWLGLSFQAFLFVLLGSWVFQWGLQQARRDGSLAAY